MKTHSKTTGACFFSTVAHFCALVNHAPSVINGVARALLSNGCESTGLVHDVIPQRKCMSWTESVCYHPRSQVFGALRVSWMVCYNPRSQVFGALRVSWMVCYNPGISQIYKSNFPKTCLSDRADFSRKRFRFNGLKV